MKRVEMVYAGTRYSLHDTDAATLCAQIDTALASGTPSWLSVNLGEGLPRETRILLAPGIGIAITNVAE
jgi:hypothetical protein